MANVERKPAEPQILQLDGLVDDLAVTAEIRCRGQAIESIDLRHGQADTGSLKNRRNERHEAAPACLAGLEKALFDPEALDAAEWAALAARLQPEGTAFARNVWDAIDRVPAGQWASYADLAEYLNAPRAVRAVATACGRNPVAVLRPCHRIIRSDGHPGQYRWGTAIKRALLRREAILTPDGETARPNARWQQCATASIRQAEGSLIHALPHNGASH